METMAVRGMIEAPVETCKIRKTYSWMSKIYFIGAFFEKKARMRAIELARIKPTDKVLEVAVGIGYSLVEILKRVDRTNTVHGVDLTPAMLEKARKLAAKHGYTNFDLREADARRLPFPDETFDVLFNSYMLDLIPIGDLPVILKEFHRVLKKGGRLVLLNLSKKDERPIFYEKVYRRIPYLLGGCRPVLMESFVGEVGFNEVKRKVLPLFPSLLSEIVTGVK